MANGWDNALFRVGEDLVARLPRRELAAQLVEHEQRWLPGLAPRLPLSVPAPVRTGRPDLGYPWSWSVVPFLPGATAAESPPADSEEAAVAIGGFLGTLHVPAPADAPVNSVRGGPLSKRAPVDIRNLDVLGEQVDREAVLLVREDILAAPEWEAPAVWLHGDLHPANILVHRGRVSGVIDFGDLTSGDPATDLAVAWMFLPVACHETLRSVYAEACGHATDEALWRRARGWALAFALVFLTYSADNPVMAAIGHRTLNAVLTRGRLRALTYRLLRPSTSWHGHTLNSAWRPTGCQCIWRTPLSART
jgi:aminoglycoside phosphotransferase (APT) family kinase protein